LTASAHAAAAPRREVLGYSSGMALTNLRIRPLDEHFQPDCHQAGLGTLSVTSWTRIAKSQEKKHGGAPGAKNRTRPVIAAAEQKLQTCNKVQRHPNLIGVVNRCD